MIPYVHTPLGDISSFTLCVAIGVAVMFFHVYLSLKRVDRIAEVAFVYPRMVIAGVVGFGGAALTDAFFKYLEYGVFKLYGITFYGGLIGASIAMYVLLRVGRSRTTYDVTGWFSVLTPAFILFHFFGRLGCFFGGCCYGRNAEGAFTLLFPDNEAMGILHEGLRCYPTQLFEALTLMAIFALVCVSKHKYVTYLVAYSVARFHLELLRGDDRGETGSTFSPSQLMALLVLFGCATAIGVRFFRREKKKLS